MESFLNSSLSDDHSVQFECKISALCVRLRMQCAGRFGQKSVDLVPSPADWAGKNLANREK